MGLNDMSPGTGKRRGTLYQVRTEGAWRGGEGTQLAGEQQLSWQLTLGKIH